MTRTRQLTNWQPQGHLKNLKEWDFPVCNPMSHNNVGNSFLPYGENWLLWEWGWNISNCRSPGVSAGAIEEWFFEGTASSSTLKEVSWCHRGEHRGSQHLLKVEWKEWQLYLQNPTLISHPGPYQGEILVLERFGYQKLCWWRQ